MEINNNKVSNMDLILKKIKKIKKDIEYPTSYISNNLDSDRVYISRLADTGVIIKTKRGHFYKPSSRTIYKKSAKTIPISKSIFINDLFWSVRDGYEVEADTLIRTYLEQWCEEDLMALYKLFGYSRIIQESLKFYKKRTNENYKNIRKILEKFDKWRLDDTRNKRTT
jgi:hypothetical protein